MKLLFLSVHPLIQTIERDFRTPYRKKIFAVIKKYLNTIFGV